MEPLSRVFNSLGQLYAAERNEEKALESMCNDKAICKQIGHIQGEAKACLNIGHLHCEFDRFEDAVASFEEALALARSLRDDTSLIKSIEEDLKLTLSLKKAEEDLQVGQAELANLEEEKMRPKEARWGGGGGDQGVDVNRVQHERNLLQKLLTSAENLERWEQMKALAIKLIDLERAVGSKSGVCDGLSSLGIAYEELKIYKEAVKCYKNTLRLATEIGSVEVQAVALVNRGNAELSLGHHDKARKLYQSAFDVACSEGWNNHHALQIDALENIHYVYSQVFHDSGNARRLVVLLQSVKKLHSRRNKKAKRKVNKEESVPETQAGGGLSEIEDYEAVDAGGSRTAHDRAYLRRKQQVGRQRQKPRRAKKAVDLVYGSAVRNKRRLSVPSRKDATDDESDPYAFETADEHGDKENGVGENGQNGKEKEVRVPLSTPRRKDTQVQGVPGRTSFSPTSNCHSTGPKSGPLKRRRGFRSPPA